MINELSPSETAIGIIIPTYKEAENIGALIRELRAVIPECSIVVVDDSPDPDTERAVERVADPNTRLIRRETKDGRGSAVLVGLKIHLKSGCQRIVEMDADFSHHPSELPGLLDAMDEKGVDMLIASRYLSESRIVNWPWTRLVFSRSSNRLARALLRVPVHDYTNGYRVYSREAAETVADTCGRIGRGFIPLSETLVNLYYRGFRVGEVATVFVNRVRGESSVTFSEVRNAFFGLLRIWRMRRRLMRGQEER